MTHTRVSYQYLGILPVIAVLFVWMSFATVSSDNDCNAFSDIYATGFADTAYVELPKYGHELSIFTKKDLRTVMTHLHQACCEGYSSALSDNEQSFLSCSTLKKLKPYYAESPLMSDHLISIGMRKLDGVQEHCDTLSISCDMVDTSIRSKERREKITEIAENTEGYPPSVIDGLFREYRWDRQSFLDDDSLITNAYYRMCTEARNIRVLVPWVNDKWSNGSIIAKKGLEGVCKQLSLQRYEQEVKYIRTLMVEKGTQYVAQNLRKYVFDYFIKNRFVGLTEKYAHLEWCFSTVLNYTTNTSCCNE